MPRLSATPIGYAFGASVGPLVLEAFLDLGCPFSMYRAYPVLKQMAEEMPERVTVRFVFNLQPWHVHAFPLASVVGAVAESGQSLTAAVDAILPTLDEYQHVWEGRPADMGTHGTKGTAYTRSTEQNFAAIVKAMTDAGLDVTLEQARDTNGVGRTLKIHTKYSRTLGVHATPTYFLNGVEVDNASSSWSVAQWKDLFDSL